ncbi:hypothetical protein EDD15DRAFT_2198937 [Pisolithus albus]|nr:hypothetical protein EDD15DRAFT_2198937 [Pisolithus albus]
MAAGPVSEVSAVHASVGVEGMGEIEGDASSELEAKAWVVDIDGSEPMGLWEHFHGGRCIAYIVLPEGSVVIKLVEKGPPLVDVGGLVDPRVFHLLAEDLGGEVEEAFRGFLFAFSFSTDPEPLRSKKVYWVGNSQPVLVNLHAWRFTKERAGEIAFRHK